MNKNSKILLIVEGARTEKQLLKQLFKVYGINVLEKQIYSYTTNIYDLYNRIFKDSLDELEDLDFMLTLKEKGINHEQSELLSQDYSDILLIFDYEPQDPNFGVKEISIMMNYFSESTDNGKLYINYPSVESFKHFKSIPDNNFLLRYIHLNELLQLGYKQIVGQESFCTDIRRYSKEYFDYIISENIKKAEYIEKQTISNTIIESYKNITESIVLDKINQIFEEQKQIPVLNTSLYFICDYNINLIN